MCKRIKKYYSDMVDKPSEFHRIKEIFNPTLLNLTLWMAIAAFAFSISVDVDLANIRWFSKVTGMNMEEGVLIVIRLIGISIFGGIFLMSLAVVFYLVATWIWVNIAGRKKYPEDRNGKKQSPPSTKIDIHIETNEPIEESINSLMDKLKGNKEK